MRKDVQSVIVERQVSILWKGREKDEKEIGARGTGLHPYETDEKFIPKG
jgi:hypothetical protein